MSLDITSLETNLQSKLDALTTDSTVPDFVYAMKATELLKTIQISSFETIEDLPSAGSFIGRVAYVTATTILYYSNGTKWVALASSQNPDFNRELLAPAINETIDYNGVATAFTSEEDYGSVTEASVSATPDYGFDLSNESPGGAGDVYVDPADFTFTIYDGQTRKGIKHFRADRNNLNFDTMSARNQGIAHLYKSGNTRTTSGPVPIPMSGTRINDTRMGELNGDGYYEVNYGGWYQVSMDGHLETAGWIGFGTVGNYATVEGTVSQGPDEFTIQYVNAGAFQLVRMVFIPVGTALAPYLIPFNSTTANTIYGNSNWIASNKNTSYTYLTQMTIKFLGDDTATNAYQVTE